MYIPYDSSERKQASEITKLLQCTPVSTPFNHRANYWLSRYLVRTLCFWGVTSNLAFLNFLQSQ